MYKKILISMAALVVAVIVSSGIVSATEEAAGKINCSVTAADGKTETKKVASEDECKKLGGTVEKVEKK